MVTAKDLQGRTIIWNEAAGKWKYSNGRDYTGPNPEEPARNSEENPIIQEVFDEHFRSKQKQPWWKFWLREQGPRIDQLNFINIVNDGEFIEFDTVLEISDLLKIKKHLIYKELISNYTTKDVYFHCKYKAHDDVINYIKENYHR